MNEKNNDENVAFGDGQKLPLGFLVIKFPFFMYKVFLKKLLIQPIEI